MGHQLDAAAPGGHGGGARPAVLLAEGHRDRGRDAARGERRAATGSGTHTCPAVRARPGCHGVAHVDGHHEAAGVSAAARRAARRRAGCTETHGGKLWPAGLPRGRASLPGAAAAIVRTAAGFLGVGGVPTRSAPAGTAGGAALGTLLPL